MRYEELTKAKFLAEVNKARKEVGLREIKHKEIRCLKCDDLFISTQVDNRMCEKCSRYDVTSEK